MDWTKFWSAEQLRIQARLDAADDSLDASLQLYARAAFRSVEASTGRKLYPPDEALPVDAPESAMQANEDIQLAILMMVAHWFDNPAAVNVGNITSEIPLGFRHLTDPYRWFEL